MIENLILWAVAFQNPKIANEHHPRYFLVKFT